MGELLKFVSMLKVEPFVIMVMAIFYLKATPLELLQQDKLCKFKYNMTEDFCWNLATIEEDDENYHFKSMIINDVVTNKMYSYLISFIPGVIWSLFLGAWTDMYGKGRKVIMLVGALAQTIENLMNAFNSYYITTDIKWILVSFIPYTLCGSMAISTCYAYVAATTPNAYKTLRMTVIDILLAIAQPSATVLSGILINRTPIFGHGQIHNYCILFLICSLVSFSAFIWALVMVDEEKDKKQFIKLGLDVPRSIQIKDCDKKEDKNPLKLLFDLNNVKEMVKTYAKKRPNHGRSQILLITLALFCNLFTIFGPMTFLFQFTEKIYEWNATTYSYVYSFGQIGNSLVIMFVSPVLIKYFKLNDMLIAIIGFVGIFGQMTIRGVILSPLGFYISIVVSCTTSLGAIGYRSHLSKIVESSEMGKVFTLMMVIDSLAPIVASSLLAKLFQATIDSFPSTCFLILAVTSLIPIFIAMIIDLMNLKLAKTIESGQTKIASSPKL